MNPNRRATEHYTGERRLRQELRRKRDGPLWGSFGVCVFVVGDGERVKRRWWWVEDGGRSADGRSQIKSKRKSCHARKRIPLDDHPWHSWQNMPRIQDDGLLTIIPSGFPPTSGTGPVSPPSSRQPPTAPIVPIQRLSPMLATRDD